MFLRDSNHGIALNVNAEEFLTVYSLLLACLSNKEKNVQRKTNTWLIIQYLFGTIRNMKN